MTETSLETSRPANAFLLRLGEVYLRGRNRKIFIKKLYQNAKRALKDLDNTSVENHYLRLLVKTSPEHTRECRERLTRLFGLSSLSPVHECAKSIEDITETAVNAARTLPVGSTFKVDSKRRDKDFPVGSMEISRRVGAAVADNCRLKVDVQEPDTRIRIEVAPEAAYVTSEVIPGPGGLPVGSSGRVAVLLSGGIDSPVAAWTMMRRGCRINAIYFHSFPYTGDKTKEKVRQLARHLCQWQGTMSFQVVHFTDAQKQLRASGRADLAVVLYRRMMMRVASKLASEQNIGALVTGENLGQVASQTLENLAAIEAAAELPVLRPLLGHDKLEIIDRARAIGTYETSILPYDDCCSLFVPKSPALRARAYDAENLEAKLDIDAMTAELCANTERHVVTWRSPA